MAFKGRRVKIHIGHNIILMNMHVICHGKWPVAEGFTVITVKLFFFLEEGGWWNTLSAALSFCDSPLRLLLLRVCVLCFVCVVLLHVAGWHTGIGPLEGRRVDLYELLMIRQRDIRVTGVQSRFPHGHCAEEKCWKMTAEESKQNAIIL